MEPTPDPQPIVHSYAAGVAWRGSTGAGYDVYDRTHHATVAAAGAAVTLSADPAFRGDPARLNPEQLVVLAAASCQLLSFLAVAARARVDVVAYDDDATAVMPEDDRPVRLTRIELRPRITIRGSARPEQLERLVRIAHDECYVARSLRTEVVIVPSFRFSPAGATEVFPQVI